MDIKLKQMIENVVKEDFPTVNSVSIKLCKDNSYKVLGRVEKVYKHILTVTEDGDILEYKESLDGPKRVFE